MLLSRHTRRREFVGLLGAAVACPIGARAQQQLPLVAYLSAGTSSGETRPLAAFLKGLSEAGYQEGKNVLLEYRWADNHYDRLPSIAIDLLHKRATVIAAFGTPAARAATEATTTVPIVFTTIADPVQMGFVRSLNRPGRNVTGVTLLSVELGPKLLELLYGMVPSAKVIALLVNPTNPNSENQSQSTVAAARTLGLEMPVLHASAESDFEAVFAKTRELGASALVIAQDILFNSEGERLAMLTMRDKLPAIYPQPEFTTAGGLISYGASRNDTWHQAGVYVSRILKGENPSELPVVQPTVLEMTINLKTARALGLTVSQPLIAGAGEVIE
jgi:putative ABC transport system substrate-binding protein